MSRRNLALDAGIDGRVREVVRAGMPGLRVRSVVLLGEGTDNLAYEINGGLIVRVSKEPGAITGVIDWSDAALTDPARDFGLLLRDLGPAALAAALDGYRSADTTDLRERAVFYARCGLLEDLAYAGRTGLKAYRDKSLAALDWLFSPEPARDQTA